MSFRHNARQAPEQFAFQAQLSEVARSCAAPADDAARWLDLDVPEFGFGIGVLHIMAAGSSRTHSLNIAKFRFWNAVLAAAEARLKEPSLLVGDWNTGAHRAATFGPAAIWIGASITALIGFRHRSWIVFIVAPLGLRYGIAWLRTASLGRRLS